jgi:hypothetical protein
MRLELRDPRLCAPASRQVSLYRVQSFLRKNIARTIGLGKQHYLTSLDNACQQNSIVNSERFSGCLERGHTVPFSQAFWVTFSTQRPIHSPGSSWSKSRFGRIARGMNQPSDSELLVRD